MTLLIATLLEAAPLGVDRALEALRQSGTFVVITTDENRLLDHAGVGQTAWSEQDRFGRYRMAGIDVDAFRALADEIE